MSYPLHIARGTNLLWIQEAGGWALAKMLLDFLQDLPGLGHSRE
ncbi:MAG: hypothetical protein ABGX04_18600 [Myxococcales bacterium]